MSEEPGREVLEKARQGDPDAFTMLVEAYSARLYGTCYSYLGNRQDAEDCLQDTFIKAFRSIGDYQFLSSVYTWLYRIAVNTCLDFRRKMSRTRVFSLDEAMETDDSQVYAQIADQAPLPDEQAVAAEARRMILDEVGRLPEYLREIIVLRDLEGLSYQELAKLLKLSDGTVKSRLSRARRMLAEKISKHENMYRVRGTNKVDAASNR